MKFIIFHYSKEQLVPNNTSWFIELLSTVSLYSAQIETHLENNTETKP